MVRSKTQFRRLTELTEMIREGKQVVNCLVLSKQWEVSQKTVQRDIDFLRDQLHAPLAYDRLRKSYTFTEPTWAMPALVVSEGEILAVLLGSRMLEQYHGTPVAKQLGHIFEKLAELLPEKVRIRPEDMFNRFSFRCPPARAVTLENWSAVIRGLCEQKTLKMLYRKAEVATTDPANLTFAIRGVLGRFAWSLHARFLVFARVLASKVGWLQTNPLLPPWPHR